jgi:hypothetical protein
MIPRLTRKTRKVNIRQVQSQGKLYAGPDGEAFRVIPMCRRPSPAERLRQRRKARADAVRSMAAVSRANTLKYANRLVERWRKT